MSAAVAPAPPASTAPLHAMCAAAYHLFAASAPSPWLCRHAPAPLSASATAAAATGGSWAEARARANSERLPNSFSAGLNFPAPCKAIPAAPAKEARRAGAKKSSLAVARTPLGWVGRYVGGWRAASRTQGARGRCLGRGGAGAICGADGVRRRRDCRGMVPETHTGKVAKTEGDSSRAGGSEIGGVYAREASAGAASRRWNR